MLFFVLDSDYVQKGRQACAPILSRCAVKSTTFARRHHDNLPKIFLTRIPHRHQFSAAVALVWQAR